MKQAHAGSCHCGAVQFECDLDLSLETSRCNCSVCLKARYWKAMVKPDEFRLLQGRELLTSYNFGAGAITHRFCSRCGIKPFADVKMADMSLVAVNVASLNGASDEELAHAPVVFQDGRHNTWQAAPAHTGFL